MNRSVLIAALLAFLFAAPVFASFEIEQVTTHEADCNGPTVATSPDGLTMIGYQAEGGVILMSFAMVQQVPTSPATDELWPEPVLFNSGGVPQICWTREGFVAAVPSGDMILVYESDLNGVWDLENFAMVDPGGALMGLDLWGVASDAAGPYVFMTVMTSTNPPFGDYQVRYTGKGAGSGWSPLEIVAEEPSLMPLPQMTWGVGPAGPWPRIFYLTQAFGNYDLVYVTKDLAAGWTDPVIVPGDGGSAPSPIGGSFDVVTSYGVNMNVLGLGPQPTCPCGSIHYLGHELGGGWAPQENMTVDLYDMDWPFSPRLATNLADPTGRIHAFWMQIGSGAMLDPLNHTLEYWVKTEGGWFDAGDFLEGQDGGQLQRGLDLDVSLNNEVVLAWTRRDTIEGVPQPQQVWMARPYEPADVPGSGASPVKAALTAWPNPFNPKVTLAMDAPVAGSATLDVYDVRGRHIRRVFEGDLSVGRREIDWNGRDTAGRQVPSGVYFARLKTVGGPAVTKLVLAE